MSIVITKSGKVALDGIGFIVGEFTEGETPAGLTADQEEQLLKLGVAKRAGKGDAAEEKAVEPVIENKAIEPAVENKAAHHTKAKK